MLTRNKKYQISAINLCNIMLYAHGSLSAVVPYAVGELRAFSVFALLKDNGIAVENS